MLQPNDKQGWINRAAFYELLAFGFRVPTLESGEVVSSGEFAEALMEIGEANGIDYSLLANAHTVLSIYRDEDPDSLFHKLRVAYTTLFVGAPQPLVSPFAGVWWAELQGVEPLLFVNKRSMDIERFVRSFYLGRPKGRNEPLDHIATMLEFLQYVSLAIGDSIEPQEGVDFTPGIIERFTNDYLADWVIRFSERITEQSSESFYRALAQVVPEII
jgi:TorA maturation chaperone TorD